MKAKKKEEAVTSSFDSFKCLHQAINMIVLNPSLVKSKFQKKLKIYKEMKNFGSLECPCCHSKEYIRWGFYERGVVYIKEDKEYSETINIQRIRCRSCGRTHALLPFGIIPYKQLTDEVLIELLLNEKEEELFSKEVIDYYKNQFYKYHYSNLSTMLKTRNVREIIKCLKEQKDKILSSYIKEYGKCFMQIKIGCLLYSTS